MSMARSRWAIDPGPCQPVSTSTIPSPAATAHALPCGTPGHGSGRRSRQTPGSTRSPRPTSRFLTDSGTGVDPRLWPTMATDGETTTKPRKPTKTQAAKVARDYFEAINARDIEAAAGMWAHDGIEVVHGVRTNVGPDGIRQFFEEIVGALPDL